MSLFLRLIPCIKFICRKTVCLLLYEFCICYQMCRDAGRVTKERTSPCFVTTVCCYVAKSTRSQTTAWDFRGLTIALRGKSCRCRIHEFKTKVSSVLWNIRHPRMRISGRSLAGRPTAWEDKEVHAYLMLCLPVSCHAFKLYFKPQFLFCLTQTNLHTLFLPTIL